MDYKNSNGFAGYNAKKTISIVNDYIQKVVSYVDKRLFFKQDTLVSGTNLKTVNSTSLLGSGNITIGGGDATLAGTQTWEGVNTFTNTFNIGSSGNTSLLFNVNGQSQFSRNINFSTNNVNIGAGTNPAASIRTLNLNSTEIFADWILPKTSNLIFYNTSYTPVITIFDATGNVGIGGGADDNVNTLQIAGTVKSTQYKLSALNTAPSSATAAGTLGEIRITAGYIYICTATNTWVRSALTTW